MVLQLCIYDTNDLYNDIVQPNLRTVNNNRLFALDNSCPHRGASLSKGEIKETKIICYMHDFEYDLISGKLLHIPSKWNDQNPNWTKSGNLLLFPISEKNGEIYIRL